MVQCHVTMAGMSLPEQGQGRCQIKTLERERGSDTLIEQSGTTLHREAFRDRKD